LLGIGETFIYTKPEVETENIGTVEQNYKNGNFSMELPYSIKNKATTAGVEYIFKN
jgi:hypothetical protein